jgi:hypothetical protein
LGSSLKLGRHTGLQAGFDYSETNRLSVRVDATWMRPRCEALLVREDGSAPVGVERRANLFTGNPDGTYSFPAHHGVCRGRAGLDRLRLKRFRRPTDRGLLVGPVPGVYLQRFVSTFRDTRFSNGLGAGLRWDVSRDLFVNAAWRVTEVELNDPREMPRLESAILEVGSTF